jgi:predicted nuclease of restriction endonuclease-like RecB superfamily
VQINETLLDDRMIHRSGKGEPMRSKSEVIIANALAAEKIEYVYEQPLVDADEQTRYPDFTIDDADLGITYYWEHCGLLTNPHYRQRWERKLDWYRAQDILPYDEGGGTGGTLIVTEDEPNGGINSQQIQARIDEIFAEG